MNPLPEQILDQIIEAINHVLNSSESMTLSMKVRVLNSILDRKDFLSQELQEAVDNHNPGMPQSDYILIQIAHYRKFDDLYL
jgi:hypothetical protein